ncbi:hypothetical protein [Amycolatopsis sp. cg13]|uniref:hypothetical protein n=1 Tax=Amycolatopsis sp. cg13 TaxID=3238807 RepID=UPI003524EE19
MRKHLFDVNVTGRFGVVTVAAGPVEFVSLLDDLVGAGLGTRQSVPAFARGRADCGRPWRGKRRGFTGFA